ncbi:hypothetical protein BM86_34340 [Bacillus thuringiensis]|uniref:Lipoprotein n=1 Tax=Bacillus thuringiensis TaxID=1428 RepID=A0A9W3SJE1_BACTU|nr:hypothetical protein [Bacillus thuringiensis]ANS52227.1 hypothetical protein BT246_69360 [Bacillus thuringiensis]MBH0340384.1 hypothetical protein [Bacillus thuringiensis]
MEKFKAIKILLVVSMIGGGCLGLVPLYTSADFLIAEAQQAEHVPISKDSLSELEVNMLHPHMIKWNMTVIKDKIGIANNVNDVLQNTVFQNITRELADKTFSISNSSYNVIMFTSHSNYEYHLEGIKFHAIVNFRGNQYELYVFERGSFYKNSPIINKPWAWAYKGWVLNPNSVSYLQFYLP